MMRANTRQLYLAAFFVICMSCPISADDKRPIIIEISTAKNEYDQIHLMDGELYVWGRVLGPAANSKTFGYVTKTFELRKTPDGTLIILRPKRWQAPRTKNDAALDGQYVTADFSAAPPTLTFTAEPEMSVGAQTQPVIGA